MFKSTTDVKLFVCIMVVNKFRVGATSKKFRIYSLGKDLAQFFTSSEHRRIEYGFLEHVKNMKSHFQIN